MSGWQLSGDGPSSYMQFASYVMAPWTDDLIRQSEVQGGRPRCLRGHRVRWLVASIKKSAAWACNITGHRR